MEQYVHKRQYLSGEPRPRGAHFSIYKRHLGPKQRRRPAVTAVCLVL